MTLSIAECDALAEGPPAAIADLIAKATTERQLAEVRLAICKHPDVAMLARQFAQRGSQIRFASLKAARDAVPAGAK